jgi:hypothetical protein
VGGGGDGGDADTDADTILPMQFGEEARRNLFTLDEKTTFVNQGSYGATPRPVLAAQGQMISRMESNPDRFFQVPSSHMPTTTPPYIPLLSPS